MVLKMMEKGQTYAGCRGIGAISLSCLLLLLMATSGRAAAPVKEETPEMIQPTRMGLLPPTIALFEEQTGAGLKPVPHDEWSAAAVDALSSAFIEEMITRHTPLLVIGREEAGAVDLSWLQGTSDYIMNSRVRPYPESLLPIAYPAAVVRDALERHKLDAAWVVTGINILPPSGGLTPDNKGQYAGARVLLRTALIDRNGTVLFSDMVDESDLQEMLLSSDSTGRQTLAATDFRDPAFVNRAVKALLSEYRTEQEIAETAALGRAREVIALEQREKENPPRPAEFHLGLGVFFFAEDGVDILASYTPHGSHWQIGYRYVRWTDSEDDPFAGGLLTKTTTTMTGPLVNYLFQPKKNGTFYLGMSLLQWSRTELFVETDESDSASVTAPFLGGGYSGRAWEHLFYNAGMFVSPGIKLKTDTGSSEEESSGGFDIQIQTGLAF